MTAPRTRRQFLGDVGKGMLIATVGSGLAADMGLAKPTDAAEGALTFGELESLVATLQETPASKINALVVSKLRAGMELKTITAAAALANARTFGGEDYVGYHTLMALGPAYRMSRELPADAAPLPVMKVLYRNTTRMQERGGRKDEVLRTVASPEKGGSGESLREAVRAKDMNRAEALFAGIAQANADDAFNALLIAVQDTTEVHRVVLPYRAWDLLDIVGKEQAHTMLRQSVRYCVNAEKWQRGGEYDRPRSLLPALMQKHKLMDKSPGTKQADDATVEKLCQTIFTSSADDAAEAVAAMLAEGFAPDVIGESISLAANQLILRDAGRPLRQESAGKPVGSVHGDSIGVHACDSANAWRNMARVANARNTFACLIVGAYQASYDRINRGGEFLKWEPLPYKQSLDGVKVEDAASLLREAETAIRGNLQARVTAVVHRYGERGHDPRAMFDLMLKYAITEDGALHAEKYYRTASEEFAATRPAFRWRQLVALARVTASEHGRPAAGVAEAREMLKA